MIREDIEKEIGQSGFRQFSEWMNGKPIKVRYDGSLVYSRKQVDDFKRWKKFLKDKE